MPVQPFTGNGGSVSIGGVTMHVTGWTGEVNRELLEATTTESNGKRQLVPGLVDAKGTLKALYDRQEGYSSLNLLSADASVAAGSLALTRKAGDATSSPWTLPTVMFSKFAISSDVGAIVTVTMDWQSTGEFSMPASF